MLTLKEKLRNLSAAELGISNIAPASKTSSREPDTPANSSDDLIFIDDDDPIYTRALELLSDGFAGIVLSGVPGTGKSWYAREIAKKLTSNSEENQFYSQFHPGYQYEDFIEGFTPDGNGGFAPSAKVFLVACERARNTPHPVVLVIDELSRTDVIRVFGEALTYLERSKRNLKFTLASGRKTYIPENLHIIGTMNPWDRGVEELDLAFERRFAKLRIDPNPEKLKEHLLQKGLDEIFVRKFLQFFQILSNNKNPLCRIGHAYFSNITSIESVRRVWDNQLSFHFEKVLRHDEDELLSIKSAWMRIFEQ